MVQGLLEKGMRNDLGGPTPAGFRG
jgi:hypothetical protein